MSAPEDSISEEMAGSSDSERLHNDFKITFQPETADESLRDAVYPMVRQAYLKYMAGLTPPPSKNRKKTRKLTLTKKQRSPKPKPNEKSVLVGIREY